MKFLKNPRLLLSLSMAVFGTIGLFKRSISVSPGELSLYRAILAALLIGAFLLLTRQKIPFRSIKKEIPLLLLSGIAMGINWILLFEAYERTTVSLATLSYYFAPVIVTLVCPLLFRERMTPKQLICFGMSTLGLVLIVVFGSTEGGSSHLFGILCGLGAACFYATVILLNKFIKNVAGIPRTFLQFLSAIVILVPYVALTGGVTLGSLDTRGWVCLLVVGLIHTGVTYCLYFSSLKELPGQTAAILSYIDPLVAILVSAIFLREGMNLWQALGGALILGFTLWNELGEAKPPRLPTEAPRRIAVIGYSGSGKSTLAGKLAKKADCEALYLDTVHWLPGWQERELDEKLKIVEEFLDSHDRWVIDGNYSRLHFERRMEEADVIIVMRFHRLACLWRARKRYRTYKGRSRESMTEGCPEKLDGEFVRWILWKGRGKKQRRRHRELLERYPEKVVVIKNQRQLEAFQKSEGLPRSRP